MDRGLQGKNTMKTQASRAAPDNHIAMRDRDAFCFVGALLSTKEKNRGDPERNRDDRLGEVTLVPVLVQREFCSCLIAVDQAGIGPK